MKIYIIDDIHPVFFERLHPMVEYEYLPKATFAEIEVLLPSIEALLVRSKIQLTKAILSKAPKLKLIARAGAGMDNIDEAAAIAQNITLINAPEGNSNAVAEHTLGLILALLNNIPKANNEVKNSVWHREANRGTELSGKKVAIIGFGNMGQATASLLQHLGVELMVYDKYLQAWPTHIKYKKCTLEDIFEQAEIVSIHLPLTAETEGFCNENFFNNFTHKIYFINTSRGKILDPNCLQKILHTNVVCGMALDVFEPEPAHLRQQFSELLTHEHLIFTPHVAGWTHESYQKISEVLALKINELLVKK